MLTRLFDWLFHWHKWTIIREIRIVDGNGDYIGKGYNLQCKQCGDIKRRNTYS